MKAIFRQWKRENEEKIMKIVRDTGSEYDTVSKHNKTGLKDLRRLAVKWLASSVNETNILHKGMIEKSWINTGLHLPTSGTEDAKLNSIYVNGAYITS